MNQMTESIHSWSVDTVTSRVLPLRKDQGFVTKYLYQTQHLNLLLFLFCFVLGRHLWSGKRHAKKILVQIIAEPDEEIPVRNKSAVEHRKIYI